MEGVRSHATSLVAYLGGTRLCHRRHAKHVILGTQGLACDDRGDLGELQPLTFLSRRLKPTEQRYNAYEQELAAVAYYLQSWRHYLEGCLGGVTLVWIISHLSASWTNKC